VGGTSRISRKAYVRFPNDDGIAVAQLLEHPLKRIGGSSPSTLDSKIVKPELCGSRRECQCQSAKTIYAQIHAVHSYASVRDA
jgi:hypothetical protein